MRLLFKMDDISNLKISKINVKPEGDVNYTKERYAIYFKGLSRAEIFNELIALWMEQKTAYENEEITTEEYEDWKANFPGSTSKDYKPNILNEEKNYKCYIG